MSNELIKVLDLRDNPFMGGINAGAFSLKDELSLRRDIEVIYGVLAPKSEGWLFDRAKLEGLQLELIKCSNRLDLGVPFRINKFVKERRIAVIHSRGYRGNFYVRTMLDLKLADLPTVITKHGMPPDKWFRPRLYSWLDHRPTKLADCTIAVDNGTLNCLRMWGVEEERIRLIPNAIPKYNPPSDKEILSFKKVLKLGHGNPIILFLGRMEREKGIYELLTAHSKLFGHGISLYTLFVGDGSCKRDLEVKSRSIVGGSNVRFLGTQINVNLYLGSCDVLVLPSYTEGMPRVLLEAMSARKPIIATDVGGIPDLISHNVNGMLIKSRNVDALFDAIFFFLKNSDIAEEMGIKGEEKAKNNFSARRISGLTADIYKSVFKNFVNAK